MLHAACRQGMLILELGGRHTVESATNSRINRASNSRINGDSRCAIAWGRVRALCDYEIFGGPVVAL
jgi:hypothetical protein